VETIDIPEVCIYCERKKWHTIWTRGKKMKQN